MTMPLKQVARDILNDVPKFPDGAVGPVVDLCVTCEDGYAGMPCTWHAPCDDGQHCLACQRAQLEWAEKAK